MDFLRNLLRRRKARKSVSAQLDFVTKAPVDTFSSALSNSGGSPAVSREERRMGEVTGLYKTVYSMLEEAVEVKKKTRSAAERIAESIGMPPPVPAPKKR